MCVSLTELSVQNRTSEWEEPDHIPWQAIMGRDGNIYETYDEFMDAEGNRIGHP